MIVMKLHDYELKGIVAESAELMLRELKENGSIYWAGSMRHCAGRLLEAADAIDGILHEPADAPPRKGAA